MNDYIKKSENKKHKNPLVENNLNNINNVNHTHIENYNIKPNLDDYKLFQIYPKRNPINKRYVNSPNLNDYKLENVNLNYNNYHKNTQNFKPIFGENRNTRLYENTVRSNQNYKSSTGHSTSTAATLSRQENIHPSKLHQAPNINNHNFKQYQNGYYYHIENQNPLNKPENKPAQNHQTLYNITNNSYKPLFLYTNQKNSSARTNQNNFSANKPRIMTFEV